MHEADDLVGKVRVMAAAEADELDVLERGVAGGDERGAEHARVEVVDDVEAAHREVDLGRPRHRVGREHGDAPAREQARKPVVDERVVVVGARSEHDGVGAGAARLLDDLGAAFDKAIAERSLRRIRRSDRTQRDLIGDAERLAQVGGELAVAVLVGIPVEQRRVEGDAEALLGVVRVAHHQGVSLDHRAHPQARVLDVLGGHGGDDGHEYAVDPGVGEIAQMPVDELRREADGVGGHVGKSPFVQLVRRRTRNMH